MTQVKNNNYYVTQGFMVNDLGLKGNELNIYAIIYGFSQIEGQKFNGSLQYLADWTNSTKRGVQKNLQSLLEKGYIQKEEKYINGVKFVEYYVTKFVGIEQSSIGVWNKVPQGIEQSSTNNIEYNIINNKEYIKEENIKEESANYVKEIIDYLNLRLGTHYKYTTKITNEKIEARFNEGFTIEDFKIVIDKKVDEWLDTEKAIYLRPETLFGNKFESYLNQQGKKKEITTSDIAKNMDWGEFLK